MKGSFSAILITFPPTMISAPSICIVSMAHTGLHPDSIPREVSWKMEACPHQSLGASL